MEADGASRRRRLVLLATGIMLGLASGYVVANGSYGGYFFWLILIVALPLLMAVLSGAEFSVTLPASAAMALGFHLFDPAQVVWRSSAKDLALGAGSTILPALVITAGFKAVWWIIERGASPR